MTNHPTQLGRNEDATAVRQPLGMTTTSAARSTKIRRRVACTIVAASLAAIVGVSTAPAASASASDVPTPPVRVSWYIPFF
jgi:hypothetical protein